MLNNINAYKPTSGRFVREDGSFVNIVDILEDIDEAVKTDKQHEVIALTFNGSNNPTIDSTRVVRSDYVSIRKYRKIAVFLWNNSGVDGAVNFTTTLHSPISDVYNIRIYDWENDDWMGSFLGDTEMYGTAYAVVPSSANYLIDLTTHPNFYWLKEFKGSNIRLNFKPLEAPSAPGNIKAWIVGELN